MKITTRKEIQNYSLPLSIFSTIHIADGIDKDGEEFDILVGLDKKHVEQLKKLSLDKKDEELQNNTGDRNRFGEGSYEEWYQKDRTPFCLIHKRTDTLAALVWFGPKDLGKKSIKFGKELDTPTQPKIENNWHTISCRSYPLFRGTGLMKNFIQYAMNIYKEKFSNVMIWEGQDNRNKPMLKVFSNLGFEIDKENSDLSNNWLVMIKK